VWWQPHRGRRCRILMITGLVVYFFGHKREMITYPTGAKALGPITGGMAIWFLLGNVVLIIGLALAKKYLPAPPDTNRRIKVPGSRFENTPLPAGVTSSTPIPTVENVPS